MNNIRKTINCDYAYVRGITGKNVGVAVLDTGLYPHIDFKNRIAAFYDTINNKKNPYDDNSHGSHVAGIIGGSGAALSGKYRGIAPGCHFVGVKVLDNRGNGDTDDVIRGIEWIIRNKEKYNIRVLNISVGTFQKTENKEKTKLVDSVNEAWDNGIVVVAAAGNNGPEPMTITTPGVSRKIITVGSSDDETMTDFSGRKKHNYSGRGPTPFCIVKPEIIAPGSNIVSCSNTRNEYKKKSGTSMSTPLVSGSVALLLEKYPYMKPLDVKLKIYESSIDMGLDKSQQGWGKLDIIKLLN